MFYFVLCLDFLIGVPSELFTPIKLSLAIPSWMGTEQAQSPQLTHPDNFRSWAAKIDKKAKYKIISSEKIDKKLDILFFDFIV